MPTVSEASNARPFVVRGGTSLHLVASAMREKNLDCAVVVDETSRPIGLLTERDIVKGYLYFPQRKIHHVRTDEVMDASLLIVKDTDDLTEATGLLRERGVRFAAVVSAEGSLAGLLSSKPLGNVLQAAE